jgi:hypothetical protein
LSTQVFIVKESGNVELFADAKNDTSIALIVWKTLSDKYKLGFSLEVKTTGGVENLAYNHSIPLFERISLISTFEALWVRRTNIAQLINALEDFASINLIEAVRGPIHSVTAILRQAYMEPGMIGVAFNHVSHVIPYWHIYEKHDKSENILLRKYNLNSTKGHFELSDELDIIKHDFNGKRLQVLNDG